MGRGGYYRWDKKNTTDGCDPLDMQQFAGSVDLTVPRWGGWQWTRGERKSTISYTVEPGQGVRLRYSSGGKDYDYLVNVASTTPNYGGVRYWWLCPACGRRVRILYGGAVFACRQCHHLTYTTAQSGDLLESIDNRLRFVFRKLKGEGHWLDGSLLLAKPKGMHYETYSRLLCEYISLRRLRERTWLRGALALTGPFDGSPPIEPAEAVQASWRTVKRLRHSTELERYAMAGWTYPTAVDAPDIENNRLTLGDLATRAGVPYAFAQEAVAERLLSADQGRTKRRKRYRRRLLAWLQKLHTLRQAGLAWADIRAWTRRRFQPGHEHERLWPEGVTPLPQIVPR